MYQSNLFTVAAVGILAAFQHTGIAALETEGEDIKGHIGTGLVNHANDSKGYTDATEAQAVGECLLFGDVSEWGREGCDIAHVGSDTLQTAFCQLQTVVEGIALLHHGQILGVGLEDSLLIVDNSIGNGIQNAISLLVAQQCQTFTGPLHSLKSLFQLHIDNNFYFLYFFLT